MNAYQHMWGVGNPITLRAQKMARSGRNADEREPPLNDIVAVFSRRKRWTPAEFRPGGAHGVGRAC